MKKTNFKKRDDTVVPGLASEVKASNVKVEGLNNIEKGRNMWSKAKPFMKVAAVIAGSVAVGYFSGPYVAVLGRSAFTHIYGALYGIPSVWSPSYYLGFVPLREHVGALGYKYAGTVVGTIGAPIANTTMLHANKVGDVAGTVGKYFGHSALSGLACLSAGATKSKQLMHKKFGAFSRYIGLGQSTPVVDVPKVPTDVMLAGAGVQSSDFGVTSKKKPLLHSYNLPRGKKEEVSENAAVVRDAKSSFYNTPCVI